MHLDSKPDFETTQRRFDAWWNQEIVDRPPVSMTLPAKRPVQWPKSNHATIRDRWFDLDFRLRQQEAAVASRQWIADSVPCFYANLGPEIVATLYGAELEFTNDSSWSKPICHRVQEVLTLKANLDTPYWNWQRRLLHESIELGRGRWISCITDLHTQADLLAALLDPQDLLTELMDDYQGVKAAMQHVTPLFDAVYEDSARPILAAGLPTMSWLPLPHRKRSCVLQADLICMVSTQMFEDVFLPALVHEQNALDASIFHLDGPAAPATPRRPARLSPPQRHPMGLRRRQRPRPPMDRRLQANSGGRQEHGHPLRWHRRCRCGRPNAQARRMLF